ncbi:MAG: UvrD-helicase domain-containing protein [Propioniciclava sp.]|uniref:UvrD-helicase domain-containing protein n=1 Tax=Propioniciclava sp. TaxID=2038686 RepID=UPI0039E6C147
MTGISPPPFDLTAPLPTGTTVLEASAGTGKTYAIAALAARAIADGTAGIEDILLITFSRAATTELRTRVRARLRGTASALADAARGETPDDPVSAALADTSPDELALRTARLEGALADFDRAAIMTTHEFCHGMLAGLGILATQTPQATLIEDLTPLGIEAAEDVFIQLFSGEPHGAPFRFGKQWDADPGAVDIARAVANEIAKIHGEGTPGAAGTRARFAHALREEVKRRKNARRLFSFDDQLTRLDTALRDSRTGAQARARLAERFPLVLVDEFQDTDPTQWSVLRHAFAGASTLVLIGDPKQAIYGFRGGDVHTYRLAVRQADQVTTLAVNHRSDPEVVAGVGELFAGVALGDEIVAAPVAAARTSALTATPGTPWERGVQVRALDYPNAVHPSTAASAITRDLIAVVAELTGPDAPVLRDGRPLHRREIAVLVRSNRRGQDVTAALTGAGIPATFAGSDSVFTSHAAADWLALLRALDQPRRPYLRRAFLTDFVGATVTTLALSDDEQRAHWSLQVHTWARLLARSGVPALWAAIEADSDITARLLTRPGGERRLTDHRHLAELLHARRRAGQAGRARDLAAWLASARDGATEAGGVRRRDTDADAVQVMTIHRSKGLQWPVVLLPESGQQRPVDKDSGRVLVLPSGNERILDVGGTRSPARADRWDRWLAEEADESLRALYVGLTRAQSRVVAWWAHHWEAECSPLHRLLHAPHDPAHPARPERCYPAKGLPAGGSPTQLPWLRGSAVACVPVVPAAAGSVPASAGAPGLPALGAPDASQHLVSKPDPAASAAGMARVTGAGGGPEAAVPAPGDLAATASGTSAVSLRVRPWTRTIDTTWRRTSYSGLTALAHEQAAPESAFIDDEATSGDAETAVNAPEPTAAWSQPSPLAGLPAGAAFGTLVHAIYEHTDATGDDWQGDLARASAEALRQWPLRDVDATQLASALEPSFTTPLGPLAGDRTLRSFAASDKLSELDFEFALDAPTSTLADVARLLAEHLPADDPLRSYAGRLNVPGLAEQALHGFLTGSIDSVLRLEEGFLVVDYKTNRLAPPETELTLGHYTPAAMAEAMMASHYPLQALLYCMALHRFLRLRLAGYDPDRHLGGVLYLFVRGMAGPETPVVDRTPLGVFSWRPPTALVLALSRLLAGGAR